MEFPIPPIMPMSSQGRRAVVWRNTLSSVSTSLLTLLGIIIGVGAVIAMVSLGFGVKEQVKNNISSLGSNLLIVMSGGRTASGARLAAGQGARLTAEDAYAIEKQIEGIAYIAPERLSKQLVWQKLSMKRRFLVNWDARSRRICWWPCSAF